MKIRNPRTGEYDYTINLPTAEEIKIQCDALRENQHTWTAIGIDKRIETLQQWKNSILRQKQILIDTLCVDTGRRWETILEVDLIATSIDRWCAIAKQLFLAEEQKKSTIPFIDIQQSLVPYKIVGVISPWNFPLLLSLIDTIPALLAGCAVLVKPSEVTPRFIKIIQQTIDENILLKRIFKYVEGDGKVGEAMVNNCDLICFTGSTTTGKKVYDVASKNMIPVFLELGGKDPALVLAGANIEEATSSILWGSTANAGQSCLSVERVYVQNTIFDEFVKLITAKATALHINAEDINAGEIGPIIFEKQIEIINDHLKDAVQKGAKILTGNETCKLINGGYYCLPTILINVTHQMKIMQEETFGPIIPIMQFSNADEAVALANDCKYGLSGAVFAKTIHEAMQIANKIDGGAISINDCALTAIMHEGEKNSFKMSGIGGTRMGPSAIKRFMKQKVYLIKNQSLNSPWWYKQ
jgi:succinate-semialdehyde dehydrogenase / glutarate-semialdehyde dehydrogenase